METNGTMICKMHEVTEGTQMNTNGTTKRKMHDEMKGGQRLGYTKLQTHQGNEELEDTNDFAGFQLSLLT